MSVERFEYKTETYAPGAKLLSGGLSKPGPFDAWLNERGKQGWLLVSAMDRPEIMSPQVFCVFSRRVEAGARVCTHCNYMFDDNALCKCGRKQT